MTKKQDIKLFEERKVRTVWDDEEEKWYFCVADVVEALTDSANPTDYIKKMRKRDPELAKGWGQIVTPLSLHTHEKGAKVEQVVIRTKTEYQHGLLLTKPLHHSQKETLPFDEHKDGCYGEVTLMIEPNRELRGRILMYGESLEVVSPQSLKKADFGYYQATI